MYEMIQKRRALKNKKGFTLIELIVVIAILGILAAILIPQFTGFTDRAKSAQALVDAKQAATAMDSLHAEGDTFDQTAVEDMANISSGSAITAFDATSGEIEVTTEDDFVAGRDGYGEKVEIID